MVFLNFSQISQVRIVGIFQSLEQQGSLGQVVMEKESSSSRSAGDPPRKGLEALEAPSLHPPALEASPELPSPDDLHLSRNFPASIFVVANLSPFLSLCQYCPFTQPAHPLPVVYPWVSVGSIISLLMEKQPQLGWFAALPWHHCHQSHCSSHSGMGQTLIPASSVSSSPHSCSSRSKGGEFCGGKGTVPAPASSRVSLAHRLA